MAQVDYEDASVTRSRQHLIELWGKADMEVVAEKKQKGFPKELYPVVAFALRPKRR